MVWSVGGLLKWPNWVIVLVILSVVATGLLCYLMFRTEQAPRKQRNELRAGLRSVQNDLNQKISNLEGEINDQLPKFDLEILHLSAGIISDLDRPILTLEATVSNVGGSQSIVKNFEADLTINGKAYNCSLTVLAGAKQVTIANATVDPKVSLAQKGAAKAIESGEWLIGFLFFEILECDNIKEIIKKDLIETLTVKLTAHDINGTAYSTEKIIKTAPIDHMPFNPGTDATLV